MSVDQEQRKARLKLPHLTDKQAETLAFIYTHAMNDPIGRRPTRKQICTHYGIRMTAASWRVEALLERGCLAGTLQGYDLTRVGMDAAEAWIQGA